MELQRVQLEDMEALKLQEDLVIHTQMVLDNLENGGFVTGVSYGSGGGGGWYGGSAYYSSCNVAGGGSGYVYTESTASNYPTGCLLNDAYYLTDAQTIAGNTQFDAPGGGKETGHTGNGYARITIIR